jgi:hypothetical protein
MRREKKRDQKREEKQDRDKRSVNKISNKLVISSPRSRVFIYICPGEYSSHVTMATGQLEVSSSCLNNLQVLLGEHSTGTWENILQAEFSLIPI